MSQDDGRAADARRLGLPAPHGVQELRDRPGSEGPGVRSGNVDLAVVVRSAHDAAPERVFSGGSDRVLFGEAGDLVSSDPSDDLLRQVVQKAVAGAVPDLERGKEDEHLLERLDREAPVLVVEGMRDEMGDSLRLEVRGEVIYVPPEALDLGVLGFRDSQRDDVDPAAVLGERDVNFLGEEDVGKVRDLEAAVDDVVVRHRDERHSARFRDPVEVPRFRVALRTADLLEDPFGRTVRMMGVDVQIDTRFGRGRHRALLSVRPRFERGPSPDLRTGILAEQRGKPTQGRVNGV